MSFEIVRLSAENSAAVAEIEKSCFSHPWSEQTVESEINGKFSDFFGAFFEGKLAGYIGGRTVVIAEELDGYGFCVEYNDDVRVLSIQSYFNSGSINPVPIERGRVGQILGNVYQTDIKVYYNGLLIEGYNIGGRTAICLEDLGELTDSPNAFYGYSDYLGKAVWDADNRTISYESYLQNESSILGVTKVYHRFKDNVIYTFSDEFQNWSEFSDKVEEEYTGKYTYSSGMGASRYTLKPLYFDYHGEQIAIGTVVQNPNNPYHDALMHIENSALVIEMIKTYKAPQKTHDEAKACFSENYRILKEIENDNYTVLMAENDTDGFLLVYINKQGGYVTDSGLNPYHDGKTEMWFDESSDDTKSNIVIFSEFPSDALNQIPSDIIMIDLDLYDYE